MPDPLVENERLVTVCAACLQASCWLGVFYCDDYRTANVARKSVKELRTLGLEHEDYWRPERANG